MSTTIDMKILGGGQAGSSNSSSVPVSSTWTNVVISGDTTTSHYDLKDLSNNGSNEVDMSSLMPVTTTSASMPSMADLQHHHEVQQQQQRHQQLLQQQLDQNQQMFLHETHYQDIVHGKKELKGEMDSPGHDEDERLTVVEDEESSSNTIA